MQKPIETSADHQKMIQQQNIINQMHSIADGQRLAITVFCREGLNIPTNRHLMDILNYRIKLSENFILCTRDEDKQNCIELFQITNEQIKQILML